MRLVVRFLAATAACFGSSDSDWPPLAPSLAELRNRAAPWPHISIKQVFGQPAGFIVEQLLTKAEVNQVIALTREGMKLNQEKRGQFHATVAFDKLRQLANAKLLQDIDIRLAALANVPADHVEEGYVSIYNEGHAMQSLHLDNHHAVFSPVRFASSVIHIVGEDEGLVGGETVFPIAQLDDAVEQVTIKPRIPKLDHVLRWSQLIRDHADNFKPGDKPQDGRVCVEGHRKAPCSWTYKRAIHACNEGSNAYRVPIKAGNAVFFWNTDVHNNVTVQSMHGSCGIRGGDKVVLAKFVRGGPKPWADEQEFSKLLQMKEAPKRNEL